MNKISTFYSENYDPQNINNSILPYDKVGIDGIFLGKTFNQISSEILNTNWMNSLYTHNNWNNLFNNESYDINIDRPTNLEDTFNVNSISVENPNISNVVWNILDNNSWFNNFTTLQYSINYLPFVEEELYVDLINKKEDYITIFNSNTIDEYFDSNINISNNNSNDWVWTSSTNTITYNNSIKDRYYNSSLASKQNDYNNSRVVHLGSEEVKMMNTFSMAAVASSYGLPSLTESYYFYNWMVRGYANNVNGIVESFSEGSFQKILKNSYELLKFDFRRSLLIWTPSIAGISERGDFWQSHTPIIDLGLILSSYLPIPAIRNKTVTNYKTAGIVRLERQSKVFAELLIKDYRNGGKYKFASSGEDNIEYIIPLLNNSIETVGDQFKYLFNSTTPQNYNDVFTTIGSSDVMFEYNKSEGIDSKHVDFQSKLYDKYLKNNKDKYWPDNPSISMDGTSTTFDINKHYIPHVWTTNDESKSGIIDPNYKKLIDLISNNLPGTPSKKIDSEVLLQINRIGLKNDNEGYYVSVSGFGDQISPEWSGTSYIGRPLEAMVYNGYNKTISITIIFVATKPTGLKAMWENIINITDLAYPLWDSANNKMTGQISTISIGKNYISATGYFNNISVDISNDNSWLCCSNSNEDNILPSIVTINTSFTVIKEGI